MDSALAVWCGHCPVSVDPMESHFDVGAVTCTSDKPDGPTAGRHKLEAMAVIARTVAHIPDRGHVQERTLSRAGRSRPPG